MGNPLLMQDIRRIKAMKVQKEARKDYLNIRKANRRIQKLKKNWRKNNAVVREKVKPAEQPSEVTKENENNAKSVLVCEKCNYKCTRTEKLAKHMKSNKAIKNKMKHLKSLSRNAKKTCLMTVRMMRSIVRAKATTDIEVAACCCCVCGLPQEARHLGLYLRHLNK